MTSAELADLPRPLLVGVSGGADSCYLLHQLVRVNPEGLIVCHLNHGLRGVESDRDAQFVTELAVQLGLPCETHKVTLCDQDKVTGFETAAREARYSYYAEIARRHECRNIALGHHADDQAETLLHNLCRGGMGLRGMREKSELQEWGLTVWRPLLRTRKSEITAWMETQGQTWCDDATNSQPVATRNRLRNEVVPLLDQIYERDVTPSIISAYQDHSLGGELIEHLELLDPQGRLFLPKLQELPPKILSNVMHTYLNQSAVQDLTYTKVQECLQLIHATDTWKINLPGGKFLRRKEKRIFLHDAC